MKNVVSLFSDAAGAEEALKKLSEGGLDIDKARIHSAETIEQSTGPRVMPPGNTGVSAGAGPSGPIAGPGTGGGGAFLADETIDTYLEKIGVDGAELTFYSHGIKEGGYIVLISVPDDEADKAQAILKKAGGRAPTAE